MRGSHHRCSTRSRCLNSYRPRTAKRTVRDPVAPAVVVRVSSTGPTGTSAGSGSTANRIKAHQLYQQNVATAFNAIDNTLAADLKSFAGNHSVDQTKFKSLLQDTDQKLEKVGSAALLGSGGRATGHRDPVRRSCPSRETRREHRSQRPNHRHRHPQPRQPIPAHPLRRKHARHSRTHANQQRHQHRERCQL